MRDRISKFFIFLIVGAALLLPAAALAETAGPEPPATTAETAKPADQKKEPDLGDLKISGYRTMRWKNYSSSGDKNQFLSNNSLLYFNSKLEQTSMININGTLPRNLTLSGNFTEIPYQDRSMTLNITGRRGASRLGDFSALFPGDKMVGFSKTVRGVDFNYNYGGLKATAIVSRQKSKTQRITFVGQNKRGPYNLGTFSLLEGSEDVRIDGASIPRSDYTVDYFRGDITFKYNVDPSQIIEVYYESQMLFEIKTGSINAFGLEYSPTNSKFTIGASAITEGANDLTQSVLLAGSANFATVTVADVGVSKPLGATLLEKETEVVSTSVGSLIRNFDYTIDYERGAITFLNTTTQSVSVAYSYYNSKYVRKMENEEIHGTGPYTLSRSEIYGGSENGSVRYCSVGDLGSCEVMIPYTCNSLTCAGDYEIIESSNQIVLHSSRIPTDNKMVVISYLYVQKTSPSEQKSDRKIYDAFVKSNLTKNLYVESEFSQSTADLSSKNVPVTEEYIATVTSTSGRVYYFATDQILVPGSEEIFFDDLISISNRKTRLSDYTIDYDSIGKRYRLTFNNTVIMPPGTTILANYHYKPDTGANPVGTGNALRGLVDFKSKLVDAKAEMISKDASFAPINDYNNMEHNRIAGSASLKLIKNVKLFSDFLSYDRMHDFSTGNKNQYDKTTFGISTSRKRFQEISLTSTDYKSSDNLAVRKLDDTRTVNELKLRYAALPGNKLVLDTSLSDSDFRDKSGNLSDKNMTKRHFGVNWNPGEKLKLNTYYETNDIDSIAPAIYGANSSYKANSKARGLDVAYLPNKIWSLVGNMLLQAKTDSRPGVSNESWDTVRLAIAANPFGRVTRVSVAFYRQDLPSQLTGSTKTDSFNSMFGYRIARMWIAEPSLDSVVSEVTGSSRSKSDSLGIYFRYNPDQKGKFDGGLSIKDTSRRDSSSSSSSSSDESQYILGVGYFPSKNLIFTTKYDSRKSSGSAETNIFTEEVKYLLSDKFKTRLNYNATEYKTASTSSKKDEIILGADYKLSRVFTAEFNLKHQKYSSSPTGTTDYSGTIFDFALTANF
ncbi:MAG: hypothetical protein WCX65_00120 [bacterium]